MEDLKEKAKEQGLWNLFLAGHGQATGGGERRGAGFSNVEYGLMAELLGKSRTASEVCCCCYCCRLLSFGGELEQSA